MSLTDRRPALLPVLALAVLTAACGGNSTDEGSTAAADTIPVAASEGACDVVASELDAGTHKFEVTNYGYKVTEFYVYADGDRIMAEVENIEPGPVARSDGRPPGGRLRGRLQARAWSATASAVR